MHLISVGGFPQHFSLGMRKRFQLDKETGRGLGPAEWASWVRIYCVGEKTLPREAFWGHRELPSSPCSKLRCAQHSVLVCGMSEGDGANSGCFLPLGGTTVDS